MAKSKKKKEQPQWNAGLGKRPRHYVKDIIEKSTRKERASLLAEVPSEYRTWVEESVKDYYWRISHRQF